MDVTLRNLSPDQVVAVADAMLREGQAELAAQLYAFALRRATEPRLDLFVRRGLAMAPGPRTFGLLDVAEALSDFSKTAFVSDGLATWQKSMPFLDDPRFMALADKHAHLLPIPNWHWNLQTVLWGVQQAAHVEGDFVELGVFKGHTTLFLAEYLDFGTWPRRWRLYDTFDGIPEDQQDPGWKTRNESAYVGTYSFDEVRDRFAHIPNIEVIKGRVPEVLDGEPDGPIAFLHVDLNNTAAEIAALDRLFDRLPKGGVIVFDDYAWMQARAQHEAEKAWFAAKGLQILAVPTGQGVFIKP